MKKNINNEQRYRVISINKNNEYVEKTYADRDVAVQMQKVYASKKGIVQTLLLDEVLSEVLLLTPVQDTSAFLGGFKPSTKDDNREYYGFSDSGSHGCWDWAAYADTMTEEEFMVKAVEWFDQLHGENGTTKFKFHNIDIEKLKEVLILGDGEDVIDECEFVEDMANEILTPNTKKNVSLFPHMDKVMTNYDSQHEDFDESREFYGFGDDNADYYDMAAFKDEIPLMEFVILAKALMLQYQEEYGCKHFKVHGFETRLLGQVDDDIEFFEY